MAANMQQANSQMSAAAHTLKGAMHSPEKYLQLLEQSINVKQAENLASSSGIYVDVVV